MTLTFRDKVILLILAFAVCIYGGYKILWLPGTAKVTELEEKKQSIENLAGDLEPLLKEAEKLKNHYIKIPRSDAKSLDEGEYFIADLIGCEVYEKELIGVLDDIFTAGGGDVYVIKRKGKKDLLLPALSSVIKNIDIVERRIDVEIPRGLEDEV